jgi:hypothetical protein
MTFYQLATPRSSPSWKIRAVHSKIFLTVYGRRGRRRRTRKRGSRRSRMRRRRRRRPRERGSRSRMGRRSRRRRRRRRRSINVCVKSRHWFLPQTK